MSSIRKLFLLALTVCGVSSLCAVAEEVSQDQKVGGETEVIVMDNKAEMRAFLTFKTPMVRSNDGKLHVAIKPVGKTPTPLSDFQSRLPPADWNSLSFDDTSWDKKLAPVEVQRGFASGRRQTARFISVANSMIYVRSKFDVIDPVAAGEIKLSLKYVGGVVVYLNGKEVARKDLPEGVITADTEAAPYPDDLYCEPEGLYLQDIKMNPAGFERRYRSMPDLVLPSELIRKGNNTLALHFVRSPINEDAVKSKRTPVGGMYYVYAMWPYVGLKDITLSCKAAGTVVSGATQPKGVHVWNVASFETIDSCSYGIPGEVLNPVVIDTPRNAVFSGRLAVSSASDIMDLKVSVSDLTATKGTAKLPASAVQIRYARPSVSSNSWVSTDRFDGLVTEIPAVIKVNSRKTRSRYQSPRKVRDGGAVAPLWFTLTTPQDLPAGDYSGTITISAVGLKETTVPLNVKVYEWVLPDPENFRMVNTICMNPETIARYYGVKRWSDKHLQLMQNSLKLMKQINSRNVSIDLGVDFFGPDANKETMVRWIKQDDGSYTYDFTPFEKYCDLVEEYLGKPYPLRLNCWGERRTKKDKLTNVAVVAVSLLNPVDGTITDLEQPLIGTEESYKFWKPVIDGALERLEKRGWVDGTAFGHNSYCSPAISDVVNVATQLWPEAVWAYTAHNGILGAKWRSTTKGEYTLVKFSSSVWNEGKLKLRGSQQLFDPDRRPGIWNAAARCRHYSTSPVAVLRNLPEEAIMRGQNGLGDFSAELFPLPHATRKGLYYHIGAGRGTGGGSDASTRALLAPGPDGAIATERYEVFREGVELCEAILFLEKALQEKKIDGDLAKRVDTYLDMRSENFIKFWYNLGRRHYFLWLVTAQSALDQELLGLASEVQLKMKKL